MLADPGVVHYLLAACMISPTAVTTARRIVSAEDFPMTWQQNIFRAVCALVDDGVAYLDAVVVGAEMKSKGWLVPDTLHEIQNLPAAISLTERYANEVASDAVRRQVVPLLSSYVEILTRSGQPSNVIDEVRLALSTMRRPDVAGPGLNIDEFLATHDTAYDWLVPDFLERRDRLIVVGPEGSGKSTLLRQIAVQVAAGVHPWTEAEVEPRTVSLVDLENSARMTARRLTQLQIQAHGLKPDRLRVHVRSDGINLSDTADRRWLLRQCRADETELLVIGPLYRMTAGVADRGDIGGEDKARNAALALDELRSELGVAVVIETHAPHGSENMRALRPFGSSLWLRWPEFGVAIAPDADDRGGTKYGLIHWRGPRDERLWPRHLQRSAGRWPWTPRGVQ